MRPVWRREVERLATGARVPCAPGAAAPARTLLSSSVKPEAERAAREEQRVLADQVLRFGLVLGVERVVGGAHVGELRVAALGGTSAREQRILRRGRLEGAVGVPEPVAELEQPPPVVAGERSRRSYRD